ncbi:MAG: PQQ-dependent sugar dehydrogenase [Gammaproteobacteria bacterium]|nr:PQQ-dependent sugar dehydrogenase [Gammaproteobacteria bacterium]MDH3505657.1 PQQ-dependent sugar dehydrogenase [Gammaproteobacteria bacterium]
MRKQISTASLTAGLLASGSLYAQVSNPIPEPVTMQGLEVRIEKLTRLPRTAALDPSIGRGAVGWARPSYVRDLPDGRRFANDSRGFLYLIDSRNNPALYLNFRDVFPRLSLAGLQSGFIGFEFHPEFAENGLFYTTHIEEIAGNTATLDFIPPGFTIADVTFHDVITEWRANDPAASVFRGTQRELLRVGHIVDNPYHALGHLAFNPTSAPGDADYGLLYIGSTDLGFSNGGGPHQGDPTQTQRLDTILTAILRVDPRSPAESGGTKGVGDYTIPEINQYAADGDPNTFGEIYAYGFRNPHRFSWDMSDGTLFAMDIGMSQIEEINIVHEGRNYGWFRREGYFDNGIHYPNGSMEVVFPLPADILDGSTQDEFTYPVAVYDHDEGVAITNGFAYRGAIPALQGKFVFGDIRQGRLFAADVAALKAADDGIPQTVAPIEEIQLYVSDSSGEREDVTLFQLIERELGRASARADLHLSESRDGELFVTSRQDGWIRVLVPD